VDNTLGHDGTPFFAGVHGSSNPGIHPCNYGTGEVCWSPAEELMNPDEIVGCAPPAPPWRPPKPGRSREALPGAGAARAARCGAPCSGLAPTLTPRALPGRLFPAPSAFPN
jgi:hypothetical protein